MESIYNLMKKDWETYCLMSGIALIEEMTKANIQEQLKYYNGKKNKYGCFRTTRLKVKNKNIINSWWKITRYWENKKHLHLLGMSFKNGPKIEKSSKQFYINFSPIWLYEIIKVVGKMPSNYTFNIIKKRILSLSNKGSGSIYGIPKDETKNAVEKANLYQTLFEDKILAAGAFIVSFDLEFRGLSLGMASLAMTNKYYDFLEFMLSLARKWNWTENTKLSEVNIAHSLIRGIKANPKKEFRLSINGIKNIYGLAGPLADKEKDEFIRFHIKRSNNPHKNIRGRAKNKIIEILKNNGPTKSTLLQIPVGVRVDVILNHLHDLEKMQLVKKERNGKYYLWSYTGD